MKSITKKFVLAVLSLALTGAALTVGVYAWFTISTRVSVEQFEGQVKGSTGLLVSLEGGSEQANWSGVLESDDINAKIADKGFKKFDELTSANGKDLVTKGGAAAATTDFIEFDIFFAATSQVNAIRVHELLIESAGATTFPSEVTNEDLNLTVGQQLSNHAANAARVSIYDALEDEGNIQIFEQANDEDDNTLGFGEMDSNFAVKYYNAVADVLGGTLVKIENIPGSYDTNQAGTEDEPTVAANLVVATKTETITINGLTDYTVGFKVTVKVWIEGWDQEAFNAILNGKFSVSFVFEGVTA